VMWSVVEQTALAEAEIEYHDHASTQVWVKFPVAKASVPALAGASVVIWTTTPWTLPGNRAIAFNEALDYVVIEVQSLRDDSAATIGEKLVVAAPLEVNFAEIAKLGGKVELVSGKYLAGTI
jgi:isoleucyl-tRNA synthetase